MADDPGKNFGILFKVIRNKGVVMFFRTIEAGVDKGTISYDGRDIMSLNKKEKLQMRQEIGMLFQNAALFDSMSVLENV
ncbi:MAG: hypothetical protein IJ992_03885, partial [Lentisphaeria bacterium]|nr:hypothetical protein [Lentisphaeria bacterium]